MDVSFEQLPDLVAQTNSPSCPSATTRTHDLQTSIETIRQMTCSPLPRQEYTHLTVVDVYDEATLIGKDFERIIEVYGPEIIRDLVPKVVRMLESLELQAVKNEREGNEFMDMTTRIQRLELERNESRELRQKFNGELELIEEQWRNETNNLVILISKLEDENRRLRNDIRSENPSISTETIRITREELQCINNLTEENSKLKRILKSKSKEFAQKTVEIDAVQAQLDRICKVNCTLRQKNAFSVSQTQRLTEEKLDLEVKLKEKENLINQLNDRIADGLANSTCSTNPTNDLPILEDTEPRFSLDELRQVLWERSDFKNKLMEAEDELRLLKDHDGNDQDPVEGPIPLEPKDKLSGGKNDPSKIRQLWRSLFSKSKSSTIPRQVSESFSTPSETFSSPTDLPISNVNLPLLSPPSSQ